MEGGKRVKENWWFIKNKNSVILTYFIRCVYCLEFEYKITVKETVYSVVIFLFQIENMKFKFKLVTQIFQNILSKLRFS